MYAAVVFVDERRCLRRPYNSCVCGATLMGLVFAAQQERVSRCSTGWLLKSYILPSHECAMHAAAQSPRVTVEV